MSVDMFIRAIKPSDDKHARMSQLYHLCEQSDILVPQEVLEYFDGTSPHELGIAVDHYDLPVECRQEFTANHEHGYRIDISKLPNDVRYLEVFLS